eukprot:jgi/Mesen1/3982/ME000210S03232
MYKALLFTSQVCTLANAIEAMAKQRSFQIVVAATQHLGIGQAGQLPWKLPRDMKFFKDITSTTSGTSRKNAVIMGRKTWESIPSKFRPLPGRLNVILTRTNMPNSYPAGVEVCRNLNIALELLASEPFAEDIEFVYVIGGGEVYREALVSPLCEAIHLTEIEGDITCDTFIPPIDKTIFKVWADSAPIVENGLRYSIVNYLRVDKDKAGPAMPAVLANGQNHQRDGESKGPEEKPAMVAAAPSPPANTSPPFPKFVREKHEESQYLELISDILSSGAVKGDRTGTGTISKFGCQMRFNLRKSFPLLTTKRVFWRGVVEELLWFISGSTNAKVRVSRGPLPHAIGLARKTLVLQEKGIQIWDGNASKEYLSSIGLKDREEGDLGPVYGFQWRHFGAKYTNMHADYAGQGYDQLADVIHKIKTNPEDRRIILSAWNPADLSLMALPPCHMFCQFYVASGELSCQMYQRSCDMGLGVPFNIASYALLTRMIAHVCGLQAGELVHVLGDAHVYSNHVEPLREQLLNSPRPFPTLKINPEKNDIDSFVAADFELLDYNPHKKISMKMAV